jgi:hypothetical protein
MKNKMTLGFALVTIVAMLFAGIAVGTTSTTTNEKTNNAASDALRTQVDNPGLLLTGIRAVGDESVQLFNLGKNPISLDGFKLTTRTGLSFSLPAAVINPGDDLIVNFGDGNPSAGVVFLSSKDKNVIDDLTDTLTLSDASGRSVSFTTFTSSLAGSTTSAGANDASGIASDNSVSASRNAASGDATVTSGTNDNAAAITSSSDSARGAQANDAAAASDGAAPASDDGITGLSAAPSS